MTFYPLDLRGMVYADGLTDGFDRDGDVAAFVGHGGNFDAVDDRNKLLLHWCGYIWLLE